MLNYHKLLVAIGGYYWLLYCRPLVVNLLVSIDGYSIGDY
jgi:hypothetical protein